MNITSADKCFVQKLTVDELWELLTAEQKSKLCGERLGSEVMAYVVYCKPGDEYDYRLFASNADAFDFWVDQYNEEGDPEEPEIIELVAVKEPPA